MENFTDNEIVDTINRIDLVNKQIDSKIEDLVISDSFGEGYAQISNQLTSYVISEGQKSENGGYLVELKDMGTGHKSYSIRKNLSDEIV